MPIYLTRRVQFTALHRYRIAEWSDVRNTEVFGSETLTKFHSHNYTCDVTVSGSVDPSTGYAVNLANLDAILDEEVRARFQHRNINQDVAEFRDGMLVPTCENLAQFIHELVRRRLPGSERLVRTMVAENDSLSATYES